MLAFHAVVLAFAARAIAQSVVTAPNGAAYKCFNKYPPELAYRDIVPGTDLEGEPLVASDVTYNYKLDQFGSVQVTGRYQDGAGRDIQCNWSATAALGPFTLLANSDPACPQIAPGSVPTSGLTRRVTPRTIGRREHVFDDPAFVCYNEGADRDHSARYYRAKPSYTVGYYVCSKSGLRSCLYDMNGVNSPADNSGPDAASCPTNLCKADYTVKRMYEDEAITRRQVDTIALRRRLRTQART